MKIYIALLRGINVSGQKLVKMDRLRSCFEEMGYFKVSSYVQSGNIVFATDEIDTNSLESRIRKGILDYFGFDVPVVVLSLEELNQIIKSNPFMEEKGMQEQYFHIGFLSEKPVDPDLDSLENVKKNGEEFIIRDKVVYLYCPDGYGRTKLNNNFLESKLKVRSTTRNWKTSRELLRIAADTSI